MNITDYQAFTPTTAIYDKKHELEYLRLGLKSEIGEALGVLKKYYRGDKSWSETTERFKSEIGDIFWYLSQLANMVDFELMDYLEISKNATLTILDTELTLDKIYLESEKLNDSSAKELIRCTVSYCYVTLVVFLKNISFAVGSILSKNKAKLTQRLNTNNIKGDGEIR